MNIWIYVEGRSDEIGLSALWKDWKGMLQKVGHRMHLIPLNGKPNLFKNIGGRTAEKLYGSETDIVVGLPDLYPNRDFENTQFKHNDLAELKEVQIQEVSTALKNIYNLDKDKVRQQLKRFHPTALKYELEMLLLAAQDKLQSYIGTTEKLGGWQKPVEEQDQNQPPKKIVEQLFRTKSKGKRSYRETKDAHAILSKVNDLKEIIYDNNNQIQCPVFKTLLDWIGKQTGVYAY